MPIKTEATPDGDGSRLVTLRDGVRQLTLKGFMIDGEDLDAVGLPSVGSGVVIWLADVWVAPLKRL